MSASKPSNVRLGMVGLGMGRLHTRVLVNDGRNVDVVALCDQNEQRLAEMQEECNVPEVYTDLDTMLAKSELDAVVIAVPNVLHKPFTIKALEAGLHVLCEKPMAMNATEGREMLEAAKRADRQLLINFNQRFSPEAWTMKKIVESGELGDIYVAKCAWIRRWGMPGLGGWFTTREMSGGGPLVDIGVHALDLTMWFLGHPQMEEATAAKYAMFGPGVAQSMGKTYDVEDFAMGMIKFTNGASLFLEASWASHIQRGDSFYSELLGTKAGALRRWDYQGSFLKVFKTIEGAMLDTELAHSLEHPPSSMQHFVDVVRGDAEPVPTGEQGLRVMEVLDALNASAGDTRTSVG